MPDELDDTQADTSTQSQGDLTQADFATGGVTEGTPPPETTPSPEQAPAGPVTIRDFAKNLGYDFGQELPDDFQALSHLVRQASQARQLEAAQRQADVYTQLGRQLAPKAQELGQFLQQKEKPAGPKPWEPPPFDKRWAGQVERDPATGVYVGKPGTPHSTVDAVNAWADWQEKFQQNPAAMFAPMVQEATAAALEQARQEYRQAIMQERINSQVHQIARANAEWFYARSQAGEIQLDPLSGQPLATPLGQQYLSWVRHLGERGVADPVARDEIARAILAPQLQALTAETTSPDAVRRQQQRAVVTAKPNRNALQSLTAQQRREHPNATEPETQGKSLGDLLNAAFEEEGLDSSHFKNMTFTGT